MNFPNQMNNPSGKRLSKQRPANQVRTQQAASQVSILERAPVSRSISAGNLVLVFLLASAIIIPACLLILAGGFFGYYQVTGRIIPGVKVGESDVGGLLITEAALLLEKSWNLENQINLTNGMTTATVKPEAIGLQLDSLASVQQAYQVGHKDALVDRIGHFLISLTEGWQIKPVIHYDPIQAQVGLETISPEMSKPAKNAAIRIDGDQLTAVPGEIGYSINIDETLAFLEANPSSIMQNKVLQVPLLPVSPQVSDLTPILGKAQEFINQPASFRAYDALSNEYHEFPIEKATLVTWLSLEIKDQQPVISLDQTRISDTLQQIGNNLGDGRYIDAEKYSPLIAETVIEGQIATLMISHLPTSYIVQPGDTLLKIGWKVGMPYWKIIQANPGVDPDQLLAGASLTIPSKDELLPLPVIPDKRIIISIQKQRLWVYQDGKRLSEHIISTGIDRSPTQPGIFQVQTHEKNAYASVWDLHMPHFLGIYEAWPGFMNGIHGLPTLSNGQRLWANILGRPASYGCIILNLEDAKWLYQWAEAGVVVEITP